MCKRYDVGYKKPPKKTQFKTGQSGNPKGRPKGSQNFSELLNDELSETITIKENGITRKITKRKVVAKNLVNSAMKGDYKAINWHIDLIADRLQQCAKGKIKRLIINLPPRSLKSHCVSVSFVAWLLGCSTDGV